MTKKQEWEKVGQGSYGIYKPKPQKETGVGEVIGGIIFVLFVIALLSTCSG